MADSALPEPSTPTEAEGAAPYLAPLPGAGFLDRLFGTDNIFSLGFPPKYQTEKTGLECVAQGQC